MFSLPVRSKSKPDPSSSMGTIFPRQITLPEVGFNIPEITFKSVLFPAPFRPISPSVSPLFTWKETWSSAVNSWYSSFPRIAVVTNSLSDMILSLFIRKRMVTSSTSIIVLLISTSQVKDKPVLALLEYQRAGEQRRQGQQKTLNIDHRLRRDPT